MVFAATRGIGELYAQGFRMVGLTKDSTIGWIKSYALPSGNYASQYADCSSIDQQGNIWIGGHIFEGAISYGKPFLVKFDKSGMSSGQSLNLLSSTKTLGTNPISTQYGGMSLFDSVTSSLYHVSVPKYSCRKTLRTTSTLIPNRAFNALAK